MNTLDFIADAPKEDTDKETIKKITDKIDIMIALDSEIERLNAVVQEKLKEYLRLNREEIPELMLSNGLSQITLSDAKVNVKIDEDMNVSIPEDGNGNKRQDFYNWLTENKEDDIIKLNFAFDKMPSEKITKLYEFLNNNKYSYTSEKGIHWQTLKKYVKVKIGFGLEPEDIKNGLESGKYIKREALDDMLHIFIYHLTKVKAIK